MKAKLFAILFMLMIQIGLRMYAIGADTACATAKECPLDFKAKWVEAGCVCVPAAAARR